VVERSAERIPGWDGLGVLTTPDPETGAVIHVAMHSDRLGPPSGGTRMKSYPSDGEARRDAMRLAEAMTFKWAAARFPRGGGKAVIAVPPGLDAGARDGLLRRYGALVKALGGRFLTGPDVGTTPRDMDVISETGAPWVFGRTEANGGTGGSGGWTALGVFVSIEAACERLFGARSAAGRRVVVQGAGSVGADLARRLADAGALVEVADVDPSVAARAAEDSRIAVVPADGVLARECDVLAPCALGGVLDAASIPTLRCAAVVGAANNPLSVAADAERLRARGILYGPDFVVNAGGAVALTAIEALGWSRERAETAVRGIAETLARVFSIADAEGITTDAAARRIAEEALGSGLQTSDFGETRGSGLQISEFGRNSEE
jgi:leucine dehydrogenase